MDTLKLVGTIAGAVIALVAVIGLTAGTVEYVSAQVHEVKSVRENVASLTTGKRSYRPPYLPSLATWPR